MVKNLVVLQPIGANFVPALSATDLRATMLRTFGLMTLKVQRRQPFFEDAVGLTSVHVLVSSVHFDGDSGWHMREDDARLRLIAVLPTRPPVFRKAKDDVSLLQREPSGDRRLQDRHGYRGSVDSPTSVVGWAPLPAMAAGFQLEQLERFAVALEFKEQSALAGAQVGTKGRLGSVRFVDGRLGRNQRPCVLAAFRGTYFKVQFHGWFSIRPVEGRSFRLVGPRGLEPLTSSMSRKRSTS